MTQQEIQTKAWIIYQELIKQGWPANQETEAVAYNIAKEAA